MQTKIIISLLSLFFIVYSSCKTSQGGTAMIIGDHYNEKKNQTTLTLLPYGGFVFPDKWTKSSYDRVSKQHFFKNNDSTTIAIAKNLKKSYPFYKPEQSNKEYVTAFTQWESEYFKTHGATVSIIDDQSDKGFILWRAIIEAEGVNRVYLFGLKNEFAYNLAADSKTWTDEKIQQFLITLFNEN